MSLEGLREGSGSREERRWVELRRERDTQRPHHVTSYKFCSGVCNFFQVVLESRGITWSNSDPWGRNISLQLEGMAVFWRWWYWCVQHLRSQVLGTVGSLIASHPINFKIIFDIGVDIDVYVCIYISFPGRVRALPALPSSWFPSSHLKQGATICLSAFTCFVRIIVLFWHVLLGATISEAVYSSMNRVFVKVDLA